jgi:hypothetical protein
VFWSLTLALALWLVVVHAMTVVAIWRAGRPGRSDRASRPITIRSQTS